MSSFLWQEYLIWNLEKRRAATTIGNLSFVRVVSIVCLRVCGPDDPVFSFNHYLFSFLKNQRAKQIDQLCHFSLVQLIQTRGREVNAPTPDPSCAIKL